MSILNYIPKKSTKIDHRSEAGGYYVATCTECSGEFYPKRKSAMYCSKTCQMQAWRRKKEMEAGTTVQKLVIPDFTVLKDNLMGILNKFAKESNNRHRIELGKDVFTMCAALLPKQSYTHTFLPYTVYAQDLTTYIIVKKEDAEKIEHRNSAWNATMEIEKQMKEEEKKQQVKRSR